MKDKTRVQRLLLSVTKHFRKALAAKGFTPVQCDVILKAYEDAKDEAMFTALRAGAPKKQKQ
jgi:hypothetical protein